ncbi:MAG TPA: N-6 DNA methylase [Coriobacteriia bacterium]|nr:N-6 DNA methylase [Coriobacteriia bacterium]
MATRRTSRSASKPRPSVQSRQRRKPRRRDAKLAFEALTIEGGLLSPDWLARVAALDAGGQGEADYRIPKGLQLRDEIGRYWRIAQAYWSDFAAGRSSATKPEAAQALSERFILSLLRESFGFASLAATEPLVIAERSYPIGFTALGGRVPVVIAPANEAGNGLDTLAPAFGDGGRRRSAFGLAQEYLNAAEGATWGLATDGLALRILRDNASLTRPAWIEADLARIFTEERYADFAALWLLAHETRFGRADQPSTECVLETWRDAGHEEGTRAREHLRRGVEEALVAFGQGFLAHPENTALRAALHDGSLSPTAYFQELLRLVYRLIFLLTVEERGLLHPEDSSEAARRLYTEGYSLRRLRERSVRRSAHDRFSDLWEATKIVFRGLTAGESRLALPALSGLFAPTQCLTLDAAKLENRALLLAIFRLSWLREASGLVRVNWRDMGPEELGSVYESLLELVPQVTQGGRLFAFASGGETKGNARKTSGSYYTPDSLVQVLLDSALEPVIASTLAANPERPVEALLELSVVDPACGSGHFLLAAARRLAGHVARFQANGTPSAAEYRHALRQVVGRSLYGVDLNSMAVELCKVSLWMEAVEPGLPLTFLNAHIRHGNALLGTTPELMANGIPDIAWEPVEGDDRKVASALKKRNKRSEGGQRALDTLWTKPAENETAVVARAVAEIEAAPDSDVEALARKEGRWEDLLESDAYRHQKLVADVWCAAFVWPKQAGLQQDAAPTNDVWLQIRDRRGLPSALTVKTTEMLAEQYRFFHWHLAFPQIFAKGGFDVVLGNPPWDTLSPDAKEFFSQWEANVRFQAADDQQATIHALLADPAIAHAWEDHCRSLYSSVAFMKRSGRYTLFAPGNLGKGDFNVYRMFVETALRIVREGGSASQIVPEGLYNGANCMAIRQELFDHCALTSIFGFENHRHTWFPGVDTRAKFALYTARLPGKTDQFRVAFNIRNQAELLTAIQGGAIKMPVALVREFSPDALALMEFGSQLDIDIASKMYGRHPKFGDETIGPPHRQYMRELDMGTDRDLFDDDPLGIPLYEGRMVSQYDHRAKGYRRGRGRQAEWEDLAFADSSKSIQPQWYLPETKVPVKLQQRYRRYRIGFCDVASPTNERTLVATLIPAEAACGHSVPTFEFEPSWEWAYMIWLAVANSFCVDYLARTKVSLHMGLSLLDSLPFPRYAAGSPQAKYIVPRVARLITTSPEILGFWDHLVQDGWVAPRLRAEEIPGELDEGARSQLQAELDAFVAREVFGLTRDELSYILDTFPIVRKDDEKAHGEYRTKRMILEIYDEMAEVARVGQPYTTRLGLPPAAPRIAHPPRVDSVVPFPSRPLVLPAWGAELFSDVAARAQVKLEAGTWGTSLSGMDLGMAALAAVLRNLPGPRTREDIEHAVILVLLPRLMLPNFDSTSAKTWRNVIGRENLDVTSVSAFGIPWSSVIHRARQQNVLRVEADGQWSAGTDVDDAPSLAFDARALVVLSWLETAPAENAEVTRQIEDLHAA